MNQRLDVDIVASGSGWRLHRVAIDREPLLGAVVTPSGWYQTRVVESGSVVIGTSDAVTVLGAGHRLVLPGDERFLIVGARSVEWVLSIDPSGQDGAPEVRHHAPPWTPIPLPLCEPEDPAWPPRFRTWSRLPRDVATWAGTMGVHATSLSQRLKRLAAPSPKRLLAACRATLAWELAASFRGRGAELALATGYSSQAHLSTDLRKRFGRSPAQLLTRDDAHRQLEWLQLMRATLR